MDKSARPHRMSAPHRRRSMRYMFISVVIGTVGESCICPTVLGLASMNLGAGEIFLALLNFACLAPLAFGVLTMPTIEYRGKRAVMVFWFSLHAVAIVPLLILPSLVDVWPDSWSLTLILGSVLGLSITASLGITGWFPILQDIVPAKLTGRFFGNFRAAWSLAFLLALLASAWFLGSDPQWWKFRLLFILAFVLFVCRALVLIPVGENPPLKTKESRSSLRDVLTGFFVDRSLHPLMGYLAAYAIALAICEPFKIKLLKDLGYSDGFILAAVATINLGAAVSLRSWGKLADRFGNRFIFSISHVAMIIVTLLWILVTPSTFGSVLVFALYFFHSVFNCGNGIAQTRYILHTISPDKQNHITLLNNAVWIIWGIAPLLGGLFLVLTRNVEFHLPAWTGNNYHLLFLITACLFLIPHRLRWKLGLTKDTPTRHVLTFMMRPLIQAIGPFVGYRSQNRREKGTKG